MTNLTKGTLLFTVQGTHASAGKLLKSSYFHMKMRNLTKVTL